MAEIMAITAFITKYANFINFTYVNAVIQLSPLIMVLNIGCLK